MHYENLQSPVATFLTYVYSRNVALAIDSSELGKKVVYTRLI
nr:hypothetical protein [Okeania sp. SIO2F4]